MTNPFAAAIHSIKREMSRCHLDQECHDCSDRKAAIRVLEAAGKVDKYKAEDTELYGPAGLDIRTLLSALPDQAKEKA